jgi:hypothetical protein
MGRKRHRNVGLYTYQNTTFETVMSFNAVLNFQNNWTIRTQNQWFPMGNKPVLDYGRIKIPITSLVKKVWWNNSRNSVKPSTANGSTAFQQYAVMAWNVFTAF